MLMKILLICCFCIQMVSGLAATTNMNANTKAPLLVPETYRALVAASTGNSFSEVATVRTLPTPSVGEGEVLIRVKYAGINGGCETFRARGEFAFEGNAKATEEDPFPLGAEGVGIVASVGPDVTDYAVGDAVCFVGSAFSEYSLCKAATLWKVPEATPEYVGLRISGLTACAMLEQTGKLQEGETVLITAAAGGAGHFAVQFAKLAGCRVIGTCGSEEKAEVLRSLGCDHVINYKNEDVAAEIKRFAPNGLDAALEGVGGKMLQIALDNLTPKGRLLQIGYISEYPHNPEAKAESSKNEVDASDLFWNSKTITRGQQTIYGNAWPKDYGAVANCKDRVLGLYEEGKLRSLVDDKEIFVGLETVTDAINHMLSSKTIGKVVVQI
jgi:NADPH:quinone reductase-like Zn-dependent oxidoreductase